MKALRPIQREKTLGGSVYEQLKQSLLTGLLRPGERVTARAIADAVGVSFTPAREAMSRLIAEGAFESVGPRTVIVPPLTPDVLEEITALRIALEGLAARIAAERLGKQDIEKLDAIQLKLIAAMDRKDYDKVLSRNEEFHFLIYRRAGFPRLLSMIESLWLRIGPSLNLLYPEFSISRSGVKNHQSVLKALREHAPDKAEAAIQRDIRDGYDRLSAVICGGESLAVADADKDNKSQASADRQATI